EGLTYDDVLLIPAYSEVLPHQVSTASRFSKNITLNSPLVAAAMDTVTESQLAIAIAQVGGIGVIHKNMSIEAQANEVRKVKRSESGRAENILQQHKIEKLPVVDADYNLVGLITFRDIIKVKEYPLSSKDSFGRLRVAAAIGVTADSIQRAAALAEAGVDAIIIDTAHGHTAGVVNVLREAKELLKGVDIVVGNVATAAAARFLAENGADAVKVGIGPGSICTTRVIAGVGVPQLTAVFDVAEGLKDFDVPLIADGGVRYSGDVVKAMAAG
ncbi:UNVERIFIED_CONTAM: hypothetical protein GTU68_045558, partial [Idotea baltica]|nr:hypothetical protein [Idotea baltica]